MSENEQPAEGIGENVVENLKEGMLGKVAGMLPEGALDKVTGMLPEGALDKATELLDRDGDGNPLNDLKGLLGKFGGND